MLLELIKTLGSYLTIGIILVGLYAINIYKPIKTMIVKMENTSNNFYFTGVVTPTETFPITVPIDGEIMDVKTLFGDPVKKLQPLFTIQSTKEIENFLSALASFIKAKTAYKNALFKNKGNKELYKAGLISQLTLIDSEDNVNSTNLEVWSTEQRLKTLLKNINLPFTLFSNMTVEQIPTLQPILEKSLQGITLLSPSDGELLYPSKAFGNAEGDTKNRVQKGSFVKLGQVIAVVANSEGIQLEIKVSETNLHEIKKKDLVTITGIAFPEITLTGYIYSINSQPDPSESPGAVPVYSAIVRVPKLTFNQKKRIEAGMSAQITLTKTNPPQLLIPFAAIIENNKEYFVKVLTEDNIIVEIPVKLGTTNQESIQIEKGLSPGDRVVIPN
ncbi:MAG: HlyD family efflux transporter periplasmic adaptor subunit [Tatlockia sp.]|nr:HlyD family efflux transporter periplasmic adaptor subunit [Tatlockia sp.]